ncbi:hypothetical protein EON65_43875 [archaeon]|nr:MAG: hypothetical protein EON65_43875 [archaeon]
MKTECFVPATVPKRQGEQQSNEVDQRLIMTRGWSKTEGIIGSAFAEIAGSKVACYVFAPRAAAKVNSGFETGLVECDVSFASHLNMGGMDEDEIDKMKKLLGSKVVDAFTPVIMLENYPKSVIYITAVVLQSSGYDLCCMLNCTSLALCDALVDLRDILSAYTIQTSIASQSASQSVFQSYQNQALLIASMSSIQEVTVLEVQGRFSGGDLVQAIDQAKVQCSKVREIIVGYLK